MPPAAKRGPAQPKGSGNGNAAASRKKKDTSEVST